MENLPEIMYSYFAAIPRTLDFALGVQHVTQILNLTMMQSVVNDDPAQVSSSPKLKAIIKRSRIRASNEFIDTRLSDQKTPRKPITRRRLTVSPNLKNVYRGALRTRKSVTKDDLDLFTQENPPNSPQNLPRIRMKSPVLKEKRSFENIPFFPTTLSPILSEKLQTGSSQNLINSTSLRSADSEFNDPAILPEKSFSLASQHSACELPVLVDKISGSPKAIYKSDDDHDVVLMGEFISSDDDKHADWHSDAEEVDFVRGALRFAKPPLGSNRSSIEDLKMESNRSSMEKTKLADIRGQLKPIRVVKSRPFFRPRHNGDCSSRCSTTSTSSVKKPLDVKNTMIENSGKSGLMFDPILNLYFDPNTNKYFEVR